MYSTVRIALPPGCLDVILRGFRIHIVFFADEGTHCPALCTEFLFAVPVVIVGVVAAWKA